MKIAVFGANGKSGRLFVAHALEHGHHVVAGYFRQNTFEPHPDLTVQHCDATKRADVEALIAGCDAVVSLLGHVRGTPATMQTDAMKVVTAAMRSAGIRRLVSLTGTGARVAGDTPSLLDRLLNLGVYMVDPQRISDGVFHTWELKAANDIDWTVIRVLKLTNRPAKPFSLTPHGPGKILVSRHEVARAILMVLENGTYIGQLPVVSRVSPSHD